MTALADTTESTGSRLTGRCWMKVPLPNWFTTVMGTGIVGNALALVPTQLPGQHVVATVAWLCAAVLLAVLSAAFVTQWIRHRTHALGHLRDRVLGHFYGAIVMAYLTVGTGTLLLAPPIIGTGPAVAIDAIIFVPATAAGVLLALTMPLRLMLGRGTGRVEPLPAWMMSVVAPMVSASSAAGLVPHATGDIRSTLIASCYALFGLSLALGSAMAVIVYRQLVRGGLGGVQLTPTAWIPLGMFGQSITAVNTIAPHNGSSGFAIGYSLIAGAIAIGVAATAVAITYRGFADGLRFDMAWWSFTFPIGTCVTGTAALSRVADSAGLADLSLILLAALLFGWAAAALGTLRGVADRSLLGPR